MKCGAIFLRAFLSERRMMECGLNNVAWYVGGDLNLY